jgi:5-methylcytosine-specific restriction protein A
MAAHRWPKESRQSRDYGRDWEKVRALVLERDSHLCQCRHCRAEKRTKLATQVDHIISRAKAQALGWSKAKTEHPSNLQAIAEDCHKRKSIEEKGGQYKPPRHIGLDGFPTSCSR